MQLRTLFLILVLAPLLPLASAQSAHADLVFHVDLNTSALSGGNFLLDFQLNDGDGVQNNTVTLNNFQFGGGAASGNPSLFGGASGSLGAGVSIDDSSFLNEFTEAFTAGNTLGFDVNLTTQIAPVANTPDLFSFAILDSQSNEIPTTGPGDSFVSVDIDSSTPQIVSSPAITLSIPAPAATVTAVPEPGCIGYLGAGLLAAIGLYSRRLRHAS
jgi:hypothetical protein